jgi:hypothetical protein
MIKILRNKKYRTIAMMCVLCVCIMGISVWFVSRGNRPAKEGNNAVAPVVGIPVGYDAPDSLQESYVTLVTLDNDLVSISAGDTVVVSVFADEMTDVYGYQFDIGYDKESLEYGKHLYSDIDEIITIFATDKEQCLLVGATMIGDVKGYSGQDVLVCRVEFTALADCDPDYITLSGVNIVTDDLRYLETVDGWTTNITVR